MKYIKITNEGLIEKGAFALMGASTKREDDKKIGFFGSGLKYSVAVLLKHKNDFKIFSGLEEIKLSTKKTKFRDQNFDIICINGKKTNLTTDMGPDWEEWFAIREIYCNALDEKDCLIEVVDEINPIEGKTAFFISISDNLHKLLDNWNDYFSNKREDLICWDEKTRIYNGGRDLTVYRKGVQCFKSTGRKSLFDYDLSWIKINESRVIKDSFDILYYLPMEIAKIADSKVITMIFNHIINSYEEQMCWDCVSEFNSVWLDMIGNKKLINKDIAGYFTDKIENEECLILPYKLIKGLQSCFGDKITVVGQSDDNKRFVVVEKEPKHIALLDQCFEFFNRAGFKIKYPIKIAIFKDKNVLGSIDREDIILSTDVFDCGKKRIIETILEETFHIESQAKDLTRRFQDHLITQFVSLLEQKTGIYL